MPAAFQHTRYSPCGRAGTLNVPKISVLTVALGAEVAVFSRWTLTSGNMMPLPDDGPPVVVFSPRTSAKIDPCTSPPISMTGCGAGLVMIGPPGPGLSPPGLTRIRPGLGSASSGRARTGGGCATVGCWPTADTTATADAMAQPRYK